MPTCVVEFGAVGVGMEVLVVGVEVVELLVDDAGRVDWTVNLGMEYPNSPHSSIVSI